MFNDAVTIYNSYKEEGKECWQRHVVHGVNWTDIQGAVARKTGVTSANTLSLLIPAKAMVGYVKPQAFAALEDKSGKWTVAPKDIVVLGAVDVEVARTPGKDLAGEDGVRVVTAVDSYLHGPLAHLEVSGK